MENDNMDVLMDLSSGGKTVEKGSTDKVNEVDVERLVKNYLQRISGALELFCSSAGRDGEFADEMQWESEDSSVLVSAESLAKLLLSACDVSSLAKSADGLPRIPPLERDCDLPEDDDDDDDHSTALPYQRRRVDYLRDILRAMGPLQLDVAAHVCTILLNEQQLSNYNGGQSQVIPHPKRIAVWVLFSVWLPVAPQIAPIASHLFTLSGFTCPLGPSSPEVPAERFLLMEATHRICEFYMSFLLDYEGLLSFWNWSPAFDWLPDCAQTTTKHSSAMEIEEGKELKEYYVYNSDYSYEEATLWHTVRVIAYTLNLKPAAKADYVRKFGPSMFAERVPWVMHPFTVHEEEYLMQKLAYQGKAMIQWRKTEDGQESIFERPHAEQVRKFWLLHPFLVDCGRGLVLVRNNLAALSSSSATTLPESSRRKLVRTSTTSQNLTAIARILCISPYPPPILVCGPSGSGKSSLIRELARMVAGGRRTTESRHDDYLLEIHVDEETDTKTLVGSYTTTDIPGEFAWRPGALTVAVREGKWVLLEDLDSVPVDIQAALIKLFEDRLLPLGNGKVERCHPNFRIFGTLTLDRQGARSARSRKIFKEHIWMKVEAKPLPFPELKEIALGAHPNLPEFVVDTVLQIFRELDQSGREEDTSNEQVLTMDAESHVSYSKSLQHGRPTSVRDLFKVFSRIGNSVVFERQTTYATEIQRIICQAETVDVFAGAYPDPQSRRDFVRAYAAPKWKLTADGALQALESRSPTIQQHDHYVQIGRVGLEISRQSTFEAETGTYACTGYTLRMMESIGACIRENEPVLLVGETGGGKTSILQQLANICGHELIVQNLSLQTDSTDLLGGFRPLEIRHVARCVYQDFVDIFTSTFSRKQNEGFLNFASTCLKKKQWAKLAECFTRASQMGLNKVKARLTTDPSQEMSVQDWERFVEQAARFEQQQIACDSGLAFVFSEGVLVEAIRKGKWILLDEINLASSETLQRLCGLLDDSTSSLTLTERGDSMAVERHSNFRLFAAMNPATDAGKKDLPQSMRSRFTELHVDEILDPLELRLIAGRYIGSCLAGTGTSPENTEVVGNIANLYLKSRSLADLVLVDGAGHKPRYTLRSLTRALTASRNFFAIQKMNLQRALLEGFELTFQGSLDEASTSQLVDLFGKHLANGMTAKERDQPGRNPGGRGKSEEYVLVKPFWIPKGPETCVDWSEPGSDMLSRFILTPSARKNLRRLGRAIAAGPWPILLEGPTSSGKTTMVEYIAALCGHKVVRINNHEHTDIQEYTGGFSTDDNGKLGFKDGLLVRALRNGDWVILDELNLAPTEVLEALNRLLDDNRELYLAEINEVVKPHQSFRLFATQNPSGAYGGRKPLSRAFRNRFLEIFVGDMPPAELVTILEKRAGVAPSHAQTLVSVMKSLRRHRSASGVFMGKDGFMTPRDLLRWAQREASSKMELAREGYMLLAERLRTEEEKAYVLQEIETQFKVRLDPGSMYYGEASEARQEIEKLKSGSMECGDLGSEIAPTKSLLRLLTLVLRCLRRREPVLLVGETGCGKTTVVQLVSILYNSKLHVVNCHATTETSDLIGSLRPVRGRSGLARNILSLLRQLAAILRDAGLHKDILETFEFDKLDESSLSDDCIFRMVESARTLTGIEERGAGASERQVKRQKVDSLHCNFHPSPELKTEIGSLQYKIEELYKRHCSLFEWADGPLVRAMRSGDMLLLDEMSLAEDAVLERLNSVLEPGRTLVLAEKGVSTDGLDSVVVANHNFQLFATMNPGGDFGKRELSPALRSRFTEIWVPPVSDMTDIDLVLKQTIGAGSLSGETASKVGDCILNYVEWFNNDVCGDTVGPFSEFSLSLRDILGWARFVEATLSADNRYCVADAVYHGACLTHLDGLGLGTALSSSDASAVKRKAEEFLKTQNVGIQDTLISSPFGELRLSLSDGMFGIGPFKIPMCPLALVDVAFNFDAPTTSINLARILRGMRLSKPILLEGSPGVGKTTLIAALAAASGHHLVRINLSEQTDMTDLLGSDMPVSEEDDKAGPAFKWTDGVLLTAIKSGHWVLLDELNLASQTVLEGLNSILDHRASVFIPEIGQTVSCPSTFRVFAAQNPLGQGGGRKGLPKSFLNRFIKVYVEALTCDDQDLIISTKFPFLPREITQKMIVFNNRVHHEIVETSQYGHTGSPWEFNLRDIFRWCELLSSSAPDKLATSAARHARDLYVQRLRTTSDREKIHSKFREVFGQDITSGKEFAATVVSESVVKVGDVSLNRVELERDCRNITPLNELGSILNEREPFEAVARCVERRWPCLMVGTPGSMKDRTLSILARLSNVDVIDIDLTPSSDVSEILGSYEQADRASEALEKAESLISFAVLDHLQAPMASTSRAPKARHLFHLLQKNDSNRDLTLGRIDIAQKLSLLLADTSTDERAMKTSHLRDMAEYFQRVGSKQKNFQGAKGRFVWKDGALVQAMMNGHWVHLRNANLCPSSVLDRLNPVLEPGGYLLLLECTTGSSEEHRVVRCHPNFRVFLSMDHENGEVSRAMRNRCVEVCFNSDVESPAGFVDRVDALSVSGLRCMRKHPEELNGSAFDPSTHARLTASDLCRGSSETAPGDEDAIIFIETISSPRRTLDLAFNPDWVASSWALRVLQVFLSRTQHTQLVVLRNMVPALFLPALDRLLNRKADVNELSNRIISLFFLSSWNEGASESAHFFAGLEHSLRRNAQYLANEIRVLAGCLNEHETRLGISENQMGIKSSGVEGIGIDRLYQSLRERIWSAQVDSDVERPSVLRMARLVEGGAADRNMISCPVTPLLSLFFVRFDAWWGSIHGAARYSKDNRLLEALGKMVKRRDQLWNLVEVMPYVETDSQPFGFKFPEVSVQWMWFRKAVSKIKLGAEQGTSSGLLACMASIDNFMFGGEGHLYSLHTMKWPSRPLVPREAGAWKTWLSMKQLGEVLSSREVVERYISTSEIGLIDMCVMASCRHPALVGVENLKSDFIGAASMFCLAVSSMGTDRDMDFFLSRGEDAMKTITNRLHAAQDEFWKQLESLRCQLNVDTMDNQPDLRGLDLGLAESQLRDSGYGSFTKSLMVRFGQVQIAPLYESFRNREEDEVLRVLCKGMTVSSPGDLSCSLGRLKSSISKVINLSLSSLPLANLAELASWQSFQWALEQYGWDGLRREKIAREFLCQMVSLSAVRIWRAPDRTLARTLMELEVPGEMVCPGAEERVKNRRIRGMFEDANPIRDLTTGTILLLIGHSLLSQPPANAASSFITIENSEARGLQVTSLVQQLANTNLASSINRRWDVVYLLKETFEALKGSISGDDIAEILSMCERPDLLSEPSKTRFIALCERSSDQVFKSLIGVVLKPLLDALHECWLYDQVENRFKDKSAALADVYLGLLRFHLLLPRSILDPGLKPAAKVSLMEGQIDSLETQILSEVLYQSTITGVVPLCGSLIDQVDKLKTKISKQKRKIIGRADCIVPFRDLHRELHEFSKAFLDARITSEIARLLSQGENTKHIKMRATNLHDSWKAFCERTPREYSNYEDVVAPIIAAVSFVARGFNHLVNMIPEHSSCDLLVPMELCFVYPHQHYFTTKLTPDVLPSQPTRGQWNCFLPLVLAELFRLLIRSKVRGMDHSTVTSWSQTIKWIMSCTTSTTGGISTICDDEKMPSPRTDEDVAEERFRAQFPDHRKEFIIGADDTVALETAERDSRSSFSPSVPDQDRELIAWIHSKIFSSCEIGIDERIQAFHFGYKAAAEIFQAGYFERMCSSENFSGAHLLAISLNSPMCSFNSTGLKIDSIPGNIESDFQNSPSPKEAIKISRPVEQVMGRVTQLLALFPGNSVLGSIFRVTDRVLKLDALHSSPAKLLAGLEEMLKHAQDYEQHASRRVQIGEPLLEIRGLVADLRKRELESWPLLLLSREKTYERGARKHWARLSSVFQEFLSSCKGVLPATFQSDHWIPRWIFGGIGTTEGSHFTDPFSGCTRELVKALDTFILTSPIAEVLSRLSSLRCFGVQFGEEARIQQDGLLSLLSRTVNSLCGYYDQFSSYLSVSRVQMRRPFEEQLKNEVKLAKWDQQSYYALAETVDRNYRKLMKILNEYDDVLRTTTSFLLEKDLLRGIKTTEETGEASPSTIVPNTKAMFPLVQDELENTSPTMVTSVLPALNEWRTMSLGSGSFGGRIDKISHYADRMSMLMDKIQAGTPAMRCSIAAQSISAAVFDRLEALREKKSTRPMKERALFDLFRELKRHGYSSMKWAVPKECREFGEILHLPSPLDYLGKESEVRVSQVQACENYFKRCLSEVNRLRPEAQTNVSRYMTQRQTQIMLGFSDHSIYLVLQQRTLVACVLNKVARLSSILQQLSLRDTELAGGDNFIGKRISGFEHMFFDTAEGIRQFLLIVEASKHLMEGTERQLWASSLVGKISDWLADANSLHVSNAESFLITQASIDQVSSLRRKLFHARQIFEMSRETSIKIGCIPESCFASCILSIDQAVGAADGLTQQLELRTESIETPKEHEMLRKFDRLSRETIESALLTAQSCARDEDEDDDDDLVFPCHHKASIDLMGLRIDAMIDCANQLLSCAKYISSHGGVSNVSLQRCSALSADVSQLCHQTVKLVYSRLDQFIEMRRSCAKLSYVLLRVFRTLIARGFCSDDTDDDGTGEGKGAQNFGDDNDGTGMGEGEGKRDVTDQIENEEQLLGLKEDNKDADEPKDNGSKELDEEEAEKGMEMENDFQGDMFDVPQKPDEDGKSEDEDQQELDREFGDGKDDNDQVVDEKMWDDNDNEEDVDETVEEKFEDNNPTKGEQNCDEMVTKNEQGDTNDKEEKNEEDGPAKEHGGDENNLETDFINEDDEENREESHGVEVRNEQESGEQPDDGETELDDDLDMKDEGAGDEDSLAENEIDDSNVNHLGEEEEKSDDAGEAADENMGEEDRDGAEEELENQEDNQPPPPNATTQVDGTADDEPNEDEKQEERASSENKNKTKNQGLGVSTAGGQDVVDDAADEEENEKGGQHGEEENDCSEENQNESPSGLGDAGSASQQGSRISHGSQAHAQSKVTEKIPNPFQSLGDAKKFWHQRLNVIQSEEDLVDEANVNQNEADPDDEGLGDYEYAKENEKGTTQTLGEMEEDMKADEVGQEHPEMQRKAENKVADTPESEILNPARNNHKVRSKSDNHTDDLSHTTEDEQKEAEIEPFDTTVDESIEEEGDDDKDNKIASKVVSDLAQLNVNDGSVDNGKENLIVEDADVHCVSESQLGEARARWGAIQRETYPLARRLCEKLRLVMEPLVASKLRGDYRTGKRINMKRVIGYIASSYRKDKIWLRRTKPAKRNYRVLVAVDDSESMKKSGAGEMALKAMATLATGMSHLEVGEIGIASFGDEMRLVHSFNMPFTHDSGVDVTSSFQFRQQRTRTALCVESAMMALDEASGNASSMQIVFLVSDGRIERDSRAALRRLIREMMERNILMAMIIVEGQEKAKDSIVNMKEVTFIDGKPKVKPFMEDYPFPYYIVLDDMTNLPTILGDALRQWFEMLARLQTTNH